MTGTSLLGRAVSNWPRYTRRWSGPNRKKSGVQAAVNALATSWVSSYRTGNAIADLVGDLRLIVGTVLGIGGGVVGSDGHDPEFGVGVVMSECGQTILNALDVRAVDAEEHDEQRTSREVRPIPPSRRSERQAV